MSTVSRSRILDTPGTDTGTWYPWDIVSILYYPMGPYGRKRNMEAYGRKTKPRTHRGCHIWALPISMSGSSFLLSVCPKYVGNVAKTLREVGTYELVQGTVTGDGAHVVGLLGRGRQPTRPMRRRARARVYRQGTCSNCKMKVVGAGFCMVER